MADVWLALINAAQSVGIAYIAYLAARTGAAVKRGNAVSEQSIDELTAEVRASNGNGHEANGERHRP